MTKQQSLMQQFGISGTFAKLMIKNGCSTPDEYRAIRKQRKKDEPKKAPKEQSSKPAPVQQKGKKK